MKQEVHSINENTSVEQSHTQNVQKQTITGLVHHDMNVHMRGTLPKCKALQMEIENSAIIQRLDLAECKMKENPQALEIKITLLLIPNSNPLANRIMQLT